MFKKKIAKRKFALPYCNVFISCCRGYVRGKDAQLQQEPVLQGGEPHARTLATADPVPPSRKGSHTFFGKNNFLICLDCFVFAKHGFTLQKRYFSVSFFCAIFIRYY